MHAQEGVFTLGSLSGLTASGDVYKTTSAVPGMKRELGKSLLPPAVLLIVLLRSSMQYPLFHFSWIDLLFFIESLGEKRVTLDQNLFLYCLEKHFMFLQLTAYTECLASRHFYVHVQQKLPPPPTSLPIPTPRLHTYTFLVLLMEYLEK